MSKKTNKSSPGQTIDGIVRNSSVNALSRQPKKAAQAVHRGVQRSQTLMRTAVSKPKALASSKISRQIKPGKGGQTLDIARVNRAKHISTSSQVKRFGNPKPATAANPKHTPKSTRRVVPAAPSHARAMPSMVTSVSHQQLERLLDQALFKADAHKKALQATKPLGIFPKSSRRTKFLAFGAALFVAVMSGLFFAWNNMPQVAVKVASIQSNVQATIPSYNPAGFGFEGPMAVKGNSISMHFKSNADPARTYSISQQSSDWDSQSLLTNYIEPKGDYQTTQVKGSTVYVYNNGKEASWVNNGIWYTVSDQADLSADQLLKIIESL